MIVCQSVSQQELDLDEAPAFAGDLLDLDEHAHVILDMSRVTFCDSSGVTVLLRARDRQRRGGGSLHLTGVSGRLDWLLDMYDVEGLRPPRPT